MTLYEELPRETHGTPVEHVSAHMFRHRSIDGVRVMIGGGFSQDNTSSSHSMVIGSRAQLKQLLDQLNGCYYGWPGDHLNDNSEE